MRKNTKKWPVFHPHRFNAKSVNLETYARILLYLLCIRMSDFVMIGPREHSQKCVTDGRTRWRHPAFLYLRWSQIKKAAIRKFTIITCRFKQILLQPKLLLHTSEPAWVKRKMLSMKRSTSCPSWSRKYSATVSPVRATRARAPGGSFIWPYTRDTWRRKQSFYDSVAELWLKYYTSQYPGVNIKFLNSIFQNYLGVVSLEVNDTSLNHLVVQIIALTSSLAHSSEHWW